MDYKNLQARVKKINDVDFLKTQIKVKDGSIKVNTSKEILVNILEAYEAFKLKNKESEIKKALGESNNVSFVNTFKYDDLITLLKDIKNSTNDKILFKFTYKNANGTTFDRAYTSLEEMQNIYDEYNAKEIEIQKINSITIEKLPEAKYNTKHGAFFKYINKSCIDLSNYGIYHTEEPYISSCFIDALDGQLSEDVINCIKLSIKRRDVTRSDVNVIACEFDLKIDLHYICTEKARMVVINPKGSKLIEIGLIENHYIKYEKTKYTGVFLKYMDEIPGIKPNAWKVSINKGKKYVKYSNDGSESYLSSMNVVRKLFEYGKFEPILVSSAIKYGYAYNSNEMYTMDLNVEMCNDRKKGLPISEKFNGIVNKTVLLPKRSSMHVYNIDKGIIPKFNSLGRKSENCAAVKRSILYADFEACTVDSEGNNLKSHMPFMVCVGDSNGHIETIFNKDVDTLIKNFLNYCVSFNTNGPPIIYFHNLKYDMSFFISYLIGVNLCEKGGSMYSIKGTYSNTDLEFRDSYKMISSSLSGFPKMFHLDGIKKEVFPYDYYAPDRLNNESEECDMLRYLDFDEAKLRDFKENTKDGFYPIDYASFYCKQDVNILMRGMNTFAEWIEEALKIKSHGYCLFDFLTISSLANSFATMRECYKGVETVGGVVQKFIAESVHGGRCMTRRNEKVDVSGKLQDFDAVSLYPSAIAELDGFPLGPPKIMKSLDVYHKGLYFARIRLTDEFYKHDFKYDFPLFHDIIESKEEKINEKGAVSIETLKQVLYVNYPKNRVFIMDKVTLQECIKAYKMTQGVHYVFETGLIYDCGYNNKIVDVIKELFENRKKYKKAGNPVQAAFKLIMNSIYGKTLLKDADTSNKLFNMQNPGEFNDYVVNKYDNIHSIDFFESYTGRKSALVKKFTGASTHRNLVQCGAYILAQSKRIMNKVFLKAYEQNIPIYYQDTDSIHVDEENVSKFGDIIGNSLGQFHNDFDSSIIKKDIHSTRFIAVGKKMYIDILKGTDSDNNEVYDTHIRMKGVPTCNIVEQCKLDKITPIKLYEKLYKGGNHKIDLLNSTAPRFEFNGYTVGNCSKFVRTVRSTCVKK